ncbi:MAG TPA: hypothetical protein DEP99_00845 [Nitrospiraceae bacterium]|nr:hypothetical protein [Nitrospiraceae bacterium]
MAGITTGNTNALGKFIYPSPYPSPTRGEGTLKFPSLARPTLLSEATDGRVNSLYLPSLDGRG